MNRRIRVQKRCGLLLLILVLCSSLVSAQSDGELVITNIDTVDFPKVQIFLAAPNGSLPTDPVITLSDDGTEIDPDQMEIEQRRVGVAVMSLIDIGRSMRGRGMPKQNDRLHDARDITGRIALALNIETDLMGISAFHRDVIPIQGLNHVDGGGLANMVNDNPTLNNIPLLFPDNPSRRPSEEDYANDPYSYSVVSNALAHAVDELTTPQSFDDFRRLSNMQKVIVLLSDSCDDDLSSMGSQECRKVSPVMQSKLPLPDSFSIFSIAVGPTDSAQGQPKAQPEAGFDYRSNLELLEIYARTTPNGRFLHFYADDEAGVQAKESELQALIDEIVNRGEQLVITYDANITGHDHEIILTAGTKRIVKQYTEPPIPPKITELKVLNDGAPDMHVLPDIVSQLTIKQVDYYIDDSDEPVSVMEHPFKLDMSTLEPGEHTIQVTATDIRNKTSERSDTIAVVVPEPPTPTIPGPGGPIPPDLPFPQQVEYFLRMNLFSLIAMVIAIIAVIYAIFTPQGRAMAAEASQRVTGVISRVTRPIGGAGLGGVSPQTADFVLVARHGSITGIEFPLAQMNNYIGADRTLVDVVLDDVHVSGRHASINREGANLYLSDLGSTNGTKVNGQPIQPNVRVPIKPGDLITMGSVTLELVWKGAPTQAAPVSPNDETLVQ